MNFSEDSLWRPSRGVCVWLYTGRISLHVSALDCVLLTQISVWGPPSTARAQGVSKVAVQTTTQPGNCSPPPGTYRSGTIEHCPIRFQVCLRLHVAGLVLFWQLWWYHTNDHGWLSKRSPRFTNGIYSREFIGRPFISKGPPHGGVQRI